MSDVVSLGFDLSQLLDKTEDEAVKLCEDNKREVRVLERDGSPLTVKLDARPQRVNLVVAGGKVTSYRLG